MPVETLYLCVEVVGCPTVCRHCWAQGVPYPAMPLEELAWALDEAHRFCDERGLAFESFPMHELAAHPEAPGVMELFQSHEPQTGPLYQPFTTTGVPLAVRDDWREVLAAAAATGTTVVWVAFHGFGEAHDRQVGRRGAFEETCLGVRRAHAAGLRAGCNVFLTSANLGRFDELAAALRGLPIDEVCCQPASFLPTARSRRNERVRPTLADLAPLADHMLELPGSFYRDHWLHLDAHTEAAHVETALAGHPTSAPPDAGSRLELVCRPNLDVHAGLAGLYRERHGNLRADGVEAVLERAIGHGVRSEEQLWFGLDSPPDAAELAARHGDAAGQRVHFHATSARYVWLDRARRTSRQSAGT